eukprot:TRINITY_DN4758_c0_g1_i1.p1 TRINITY_DN4758_c0_g1~~TRINITY_DN4758_c0_g1_i1.p1  ORF type:complete len:449 (+),score=84.90 TRINITY_DN4758_c0_g1_i1:99-1349(+)
MMVLSLSVMFIEVMLVPALPYVLFRYPDQEVWIPWVLSAYMVTGAVTTPIFGSLSTRIGIKPTLAICLTCYVLGVVGCGLSFLVDNIGLLIALRALQGFGMGSFTLCFTLIKATFPPAIMGPALGLVSSMFAVGSAFGLLGGGWLLDEINFTYHDIHVEWACLFWIAGPVVFLLVFAFMFTIKEPEGLRKTQKKLVDIAGGLLLSAGVAALLIGLTLGEQGWRKPTPIALLCGSPIILVLFVLWETYYKEGAMVPVKMMLAQKTLFFLNVVAMVIGYGMFSVFQTLPFYLSNQAGPFKYTDTLQIGLLMFGSSIPSLVVAPVSAVLAKKISPQNILTACMTEAFFALVLLIAFHGTVFQVVAVQVIMGFGVGGIMTMLLTILSVSVSAQDFSTAAGAPTVHHGFVTFTLPSVTAQV